MGVMLQRVYPDRIRPTPTQCETLASPLGTSCLSGPSPSNYAYGPECRRHCGSFFL